MQQPHRASTGSQQNMITGGRPAVSEVEGTNRGKAQLIVGIDFVSIPILVGYGKTWG
jgi:hypothetical protein